MKSIERIVYMSGDATKIEYKKLLEENNMPKNIDYLQIDLDAGNGSTMEALEKMDNEIFDDYKFATITLNMIIVRVITNQPVKSLEKYSRSVDTYLYLTMYTTVNRMSYMRIGTYTQTSLTWNMLRN